MLKQTVESRLKQKGCFLDKCEVEQAVREYIKKYLGLDCYAEDEAEYPMYDGEEVRYTGYNITFKKLKSNATKP